MSEFRDRLFLARAHEAIGAARGFASALAAADRMAASMSLGPEWLAILGKLHARAGQLQQAREILARLSKAVGVATADSSVNRDTASDRAGVDLLRGEIALAEGRPADAAALFESASLLDGGPPVAPRPCSPGRDLRTARARGRGASELRAPPGHLEGRRYGRRRAEDRPRARDS